jgi:hypothetical protein
MGIAIFKWPPGPMDQGSAAVILASTVFWCAQSIVNGLVSRFPGQDG